jgi:hypothetical protein
MTYRNELAGNVIKSGFENSWAFGGEGTALFKGDIGESLKVGGLSGLYGFIMSGTVGYLTKANPELFTNLLQKQVESIGVPVSIDGKSIPALN